MRRWLLVITLLALAVPAAADPIILSGPGWTTAPHQRWWDHRSYDGNGCAHVGIFLTATPCSDVPGFYQNSPGLSTLEWLGDGTTTWRWDATNPPNYYDAYQVLQSVSDWTARDRYYAMLTGDLLFVTPAGTWSSSTLDQGRSHFALFRSGQTYWMGIEDATWATPRTADFDYNDLIVTWEDPPNIPEPGTMVLFGTGALWMARKLRRRTP